MQKVLKVHVSGQVICEGATLCGLFITADRIEPKVIFPVNESNGIMAMDNEQNLYILCSSYSCSDGKLSRINGDYVQYSYGKIQSIGSTWIYFDSYSGKLQHINSTWVYYDSYNGTIKQIGNTWVYYDGYNGKVKQVGNAWVYYDDYNGKVKQIGDTWVYYDSYSGKIKQIGDVWF